MGKRRSKTGASSQDNTQKVVAPAAAVPASPGPRMQKTASAKASLTEDRTTAAGDKGQPTGHPLKGQARTLSAPADAPAAPSDTRIATSSSATGSTTGSSKPAVAQGKTFTNTSSSEGDSDVTDASYVTEAVVAAAASVIDATSAGTSQAELEDAPGNQPKQGNGTTATSKQKDSTGQGVKAVRDGRSGDSKSTTAASTPMGSEGAAAVSQPQSGKAATAVSKQEDSLSAMAVSHKKGGKGATAPRQPEGGEAATPGPTAGPGSTAGKPDSKAAIKADSQTGGAPPSRDKVTANHAVAEKAAGVKFASKGPATTSSSSGSGSGDVGDVSKGANVLVDRLSDSTAPPSEAATAAAGATIAGGSSSDTAGTDALTAANGSTASPETYDSSVGSATKPPSALEPVLGQVEGLPRPAAAAPADTPLGLAHGPEGSVSGDTGGPVAANSVRSIIKDFISTDSSSSSSSKDLPLVDTEQPAIGPADTTTSSSSSSGKYRPLVEAEQSAVQPTGQQEAAQMPAQSISYQSAGTVISGSGNGNGNSRSSKELSFAEKLQPAVRPTAQFGSKQAPMPAPGAEDMGATGASNSAGGSASNSNGEGSIVAAVKLSLQEAEQAATLGESPGTQQQGPAAPAAVGSPLVPSATVDTFMSQPGQVISSAPGGSNSSSVGGSSSITATPHNVVSAAASANFGTSSTSSNTGTKATGHTAAVTAHGSLGSTAGSISRGSTDSQVTPATPLQDTGSTDTSSSSGSGKLAAPGSATQGAVNISSSSMAQAGPGSAAAPPTTPAAPRTKLTGHKVAPHRTTPSAPPGPPPYDLEVSQEAAATIAAIAAAGSSLKPFPPALLPAVGTSSDLTGRHMEVLTVWYNKFCCDSEAQQRLALASHCQPGMIFEDNFIKVSGQSMVDVQFYALKRVLRGMDLAPEKIEVLPAAPGCPTYTLRIISKIAFKLWSWRRHPMLTVMFPALLLLPETFTSWVTDELTVSRQDNKIVSYKQRVHNIPTAPTPVRWMLGLATSWTLMYMLEW